MSEHSSSDVSSIELPSSDVVAGTAPVIRRTWQSIPSSSQPTETSREFHHHQQQQVQEVPEMQEVQHQNNPNNNDILLTALNILNHRYVLLL